MDRSRIAYTEPWDRTTTAVASYQVISALCWTPFALILVRNAPQRSSSRKVRLRELVDQNPRLHGPVVLVERREQL